MLTKRRVHALTIPFDGVIIVIIIDWKRAFDFFLKVSRLMSISDLWVEVFLKVLRGWEVLIESTWKLLFEGLIRQPSVLDLPLSFWAKFLPLDDT
jgi:hypothetical protein